MKIVFMGTPEFSVPSLDILLKNHYDIVGVVTAMDKPAGRGRKINESAVKKYALEKGLKILQPEKLKSEGFVQQLSSLNADMFIVVAFRMLPEEVWAMPSKGTINLHGSLLPQYRGAAPINWAVINGEKETGVTTFFIEREIDTGNIIFNDKIKISEETTAGELHDEMMEVGAKLVLRTVRAIEDGGVQVVSQKKLFENGVELKSAPKINKETCKINWSDEARNVHNLIRGLSPFPGAWTEMKKEKDVMQVKIYQASYASDIGLVPGQIKLGGNKDFMVGTGNGTIYIKEIQLPGKKRLEIEDFLRGQDVSGFCFV